MVKNLPANAGDRRDCRFDPWVGNIPWRRTRQPTPVFLPAESHGQRSLAGYSPYGRKESNATCSSGTVGLAGALSLWGCPSPFRTWVSVSFVIGEWDVSGSVPEKGQILSFCLDFLSLLRGPWVCPLGGGLNPATALSLPGVLGGAHRGGCRGCHHLLLPALPPLPEPE